MILLDVNILVQIHREDANQHEPVTAWVKGKIAEGQALAVSELVLSSFMRVVTHPKVFSPPSPIEYALEFANDIRDGNNIGIIAPGENHWRIFAELCSRYEATGNLIPDAWHAALAIEYGCDWVSMDRGFSRFQTLRWYHPLDT